MEPATDFILDVNEKLYCFIIIKSTQFKAWKKPTKILESILHQYIDVACMDMLFCS